MGVNQTNVHNVEQIVEYSLKNNKHVSIMKQNPTE